MILSKAPVGFTWVKPTAVGIKVKPKTYGIFPHVGYKGVMPVENIDFNTKPEWKLTYIPVELV